MPTAAKRAKRERKRIAKAKQRKEKRIIVDKLCYENERLKQLIKKEERVHQELVQSTYDYKGIERGHIISIFFDTFQNGLCTGNEYAFLAKYMIFDMLFLHFEGRSYLIEQLELYTELYNPIFFDKKNITVLAQQEMVRLDLLMHLELTSSALTQIYRGFLKIQHLKGKKIQVPFTMLFYFHEKRIVRVEWNCDYLKAWMEVTDLVTALQVLKFSNLTLPQGIIHL